MITQQDIQKWADSNPTFAQDQYNIDKLAEFHRQQGILNDPWLFDQFVKRNHGHFHWLEGEKAPAKRGDLFNRLADVGILKSGHLSWSEQQQIAADAEKKRQDRQNEAAIRNERLELKKELAAAQCLTIWYSNGRIDHGSSQQEKAKAITAIAGKIKAFNQQHPLQAITVN